MADRTELMGLPREDVAHVADAVAAYAITYLQPDRSDAAPDRLTPAEGADGQEILLLHAGCLVVSASLHSLVDPIAAVPLWQRAGDLYAVLGRSYAVPCSLAGGVLEHAARFVDDESAEPHHRLLAAAALTVAVELRPDYYDRWRERWTSMWGDVRSKGVGELSLPLHLWVDVTDAVPEVASGGDGSADQLRDSVVGLLLRADERLADDRADTFHWMGLESDALPVDPEVLAAMVVAVAAGVGEVDVSPRASVPLSVARELRQPRGG